MPKFISFIKTLLVLGVLTIIGVTIFIYSGVYPIGADVPHNAFTFSVLEIIREKSVKRASNDVEVPNDLKSVERLLAGGADYNDMCASCHSKPGETDNDFSIGLYPRPPNLYSENSISADNIEFKRQFWIIKHGIKASGMPAWGKTHSDERIWNMVAFLQQLPRLNDTQYQIMTARGGE